MSISLIHSDDVRTFYCCNSCDIVHWYLLHSFDVYVLFIFMLFVFINACRCQIRFPYNMMFVMFYSNTTGATSRAETDNPSGSPGFISRFCGVRLAPFCVFCLLFCRLLFVPLSCLFLNIVWSVFFNLWFPITASLSSKISSMTYACLFSFQLKSNDLYKQYLVLSFSFCLVFFIIFDRLVAYSTTYNNITFYHKLTPWS